MTKRKLTVVQPVNPAPAIKESVSYEQLTQAYSTWGGKLLQHTDVLHAIQAKKEFRPITVQLAPTEACDSNCPFCSVSWRPVDKKIPFATIEKGLKEFRELGAKSIELSVRGSELIPHRDANGYISITTIKDIVENRKPVRSFTIDNENKYVEDKITDWISHPQHEPLWKVTLVDGRNITVTKSHSIFFYENSKIIYKPLKEASVGELVVVTSGKPAVKIMEDITLGGITYKVTPEFCRLLGYFVAEGSYTQQRNKIPHGITFTFGPYSKEKEKRYVDDVVELLAQIGFKASVDFAPNKTTVRVARQAAWKLMYETGLGSLAINKRVPDLIFNTTSLNQMEFLKGLYGGDGNFRNTKLNNSGKNHRNSLELKTASVSLQMTLGYLLDQLGVECSFGSGINQKRMIKNRTLPLNRYYTVSLSNKRDIQGLFRDVVAWVGGIPKYSNSKYSSGGPKTRRIPIADGCFALPIKSIEELPIKEDVVYDISVGNTHRFESSYNILCHNTGGGNPLIYRDGNKNINDVIELAHDLGYEIGVITNTEKLSRHIKPENADKLSWIRISLIKLDEGKSPEDYDFSGFPISKMGFSYIIYEGTTVESIEKIAKLVELNPEIKFVRIASDCLTEESLTIKKDWGDIVKTLDTHQKFFIKEINDTFHAYQGGCWVGMIRPYWVWNGVYMCTSHVLKHRNYHDTWKLCDGDKIQETWDKMNARFKAGQNPYDIDIQGQCWHCYYQRSNEVLYYVVNELPDKNFA
jgi:hypothetical protein